MSERTLEVTTDVAAGSVGDPLSRCLVLLLKGVIYRQEQLQDWTALMRYQGRARDHLGVLGLQLVIDENEGWAFVRGRTDDTDEGPSGVPRLAARRELSFQVSVLIALLLRRRVAEADAQSGDTRLVLTRTELIDLVRVFLPEQADEKRLFEKIDSHIGQVEKLGFLRRLPTQSAEATFEVRRIIRAFVDAQWLHDLNQRLAGYRAALGRDLGGSDE